MIRSLLTLSAASLLLAASATASADLLTPDEPSCSGKKVNDACATSSGAAGTCAAIVDGKGRAHLECKAGAPLLQPKSTAAATATAAPQPTSAATPQPTSAPAPTPTSAPSAAAPPASGCSVEAGAAGSIGALAPLLVAALAARRRKKR